MGEPFLGEIKMGGWNFAPRGWAMCDGQLLPIASYTALFSLLGTMFGGDGRTSFGLPELRGRFPMHQGNGPGLSPAVMGQKAGVEEVALTVNEMPSHNHNVTLRADPAAANSTDPTGRILGNGFTAYRNNRSPSNDVSFDAAAIQQSNAGGNLPHYNMPPYQVVNFVIALQGLFPSRS
ncbi:phage tail protein [Pseudaestuariivita atlantica]|uniref:Phage tail collar domain-containing protein n=1 Tax=Pseudaestuariivita atlantica TaxID=1317121 RepID=A0A0L1JMG9_9RHOB|nr:tail fiber protein [Pseudaestuariivita atlantica]KNG92941.1 hypothetical protein ATO11_13470 [Pseudaestuariivita atlantica]